MDIKITNIRRLFSPLIFKFSLILAQNTLWLHFKDKSIMAQKKIKQGHCVVFSSQFGLLLGEFLGLCSTSWGALERCSILVKGPFGLGCRCTRDSSSKCKALWNQEGIFVYYDYIQNWIKADRTELMNLLVWQWTNLRDQ